MVRRCRCDQRSNAFRLPRCLLRDGLWGAHQGIAVTGESGLPGGQRWEDSISGTGQGGFKRAGLRGRIECIEKIKLIVMMSLGLWVFGSGRNVRMIPRF